MNATLQELLNKATLEELAEVKDFAEKQVKAAREARFQELCNQFTEVVNTIHKEFPLAEILCDEADEFGDLIDVLNTDGDKFQFNMS